MFGIPEAGKAHFVTQTGKVEGTGERLLRRIALGNGGEIKNRKRGFHAPEMGAGPLAVKQARAK